MTRNLSSADVLMQIAIAAAIHWWVGDEWTVAAFLQRCGFVVPVALLAVSWWRSMLDALRGLQATPRTTSVGVTPELRKAYEFYVKNYRH